MGLSFSARTENAITQQAAYQTSTKSKIWDVCVKDAHKDTYGFLMYLSLIADAYHFYDTHMIIYFFALILHTLAAFIAYGDDL